MPSIQLRNLKSGPTYYLRLKDTFGNVTGVKGQWFMKRSIQTTQRKAMTAARQIQKILDEGKNPFSDNKPLRIGIVQLSKEYINDLAPSWSKRTLEIRSESLAKLLKATGDIPIDKFDKDAVQAVRAALMSNLGPHTVNIHLRGIRAFVNWVAEEKLTEWKPPKIAQVKAPGPEHRDYLTQDELNAVLLAAEDIKIKGTSVAPYLAFLALTGMRRGEALACESSWVSDKAILVPSGITKNSKKRAVPIFPGCQQLIDQLAIKRGKLFPDMTENVSRRFSEACKVAEIERPMHLHNLRDTFCVTCLLAGVPLLVVAKWTGHDPRVLLDHYAHIGIEDTWSMVDRAHEQGFSTVSIPQCHK